MIKKLNEEAALKFKTLSPEEKKKKGVLGRLYGPVASFRESTRNGRKYTSDLWEKLFESPLIKERFANGGIFGQLCHPEYEEVDMEKIACVMPEPPVKDDKGDLIAYVDIVDTPCGRIAYQLAKYGYNFGISSRGTGDLIEGPDGEEVDPDTYQLNAFDLVEIPAVENARLSFVESLDNKRYGKTLKQRLTEELNKSTDSERKIMEESLENLNIKLNEDEIVNDEKLDAIKDEVVPEMEFDNDIEFISEEEADKIYDGEVNGKYPVMKGRFIIKNPTVDGEPVEGKVVAIDNSTEDAWTEEFDSEEEAIKWLEGEFEVGEEVDEQFYLRHDDVDKARDALLNEVDHEELLKALLAKNIDVDTIEELCRKFGVESKDFGYNMMTKDEMESEFGTRDIDDLVKEESIGESCGDKKVEEEKDEEVDNVKEESLVNQLQETLLKNKELEKDNLELQEKLSVCNAKELGLEEDLKRYKSSTISLSETAKKVKPLTSKVSLLEKKLNVKSKIVISKTEEVKRLKENLEKGLTESKELKESVNKLESEVNELNEKLEEKSNLLNESKLTIKKYQRALKESRDAYIESKAIASGLKKEDVLSKLNESYTLKDVDSICEELIGYKRNISKLPFRITEDTKINFKSSKESIYGNQGNFSDDDYVSDSLLRIANLK